MKKYLHIIVPVISVLLCSLFAFSSLDDEIYDMFLHATPTLKEDPSVLLVNIDDRAVDNVGLWPWNRDIMADAIVLMKELGAAAVVFDLSYLNRSPVKVDPAYVSQELPGYLDEGFDRIDETVSQVMDAFESRFIGPADAPEYKRLILENNREVRNSLNASISYVTRDLDEYFAKSLRFFGDSYLTLTMVMEEDIPGKDKVWNVSAEDREILEGKIALRSVRGEKDSKTREHPGITPSIAMLLSQARSAGFVNAQPDADGYRRRVNLLEKWNGSYYGQLVFTPLLARLGNPGVTVTNSAITLTGATVNGEKKDIDIPRSTDGSILINWPKKKYVDYNGMSVSDLVNYGIIEKGLAENLRYMKDAGFFNYWGESENPLDLFDAAAYLRDELGKGEDPENGITFAQWLDYRERFFSSAGRYLNGETEAIILGTELDDATVEFVSKLFSAARGQYSNMAILRERVKPVMDGAFAIVGVTVTSMTDVGLTAFEERFPNVGIHATLANMILSGQFLDDAPIGVSVFIALILALVLGYIIHKLDTKKAMLYGIGTLVLTVAALFAFFLLSKRYIGVVIPFASAAATFLVLTGSSFLTTIREKSFLRSAFSRYLSPAVINEIINDPSKLNLGGEKREMTAIFTDLQGFSSISEKLDPTDLVALLNNYLTAMSNIVLENRGTIDKYEGDAIIAFFGAPIPTEDHAALACRTALAMKRTEKELNARFLQEGLSPTPLFTRIGINTGDMIVGNMGTPNKMDYTIMGNAVNLASRLEGVNKKYRTGGILISDYTKAAIGDEFLVRSLDRVRVVGVNTPLRLYELLETKSDADGAITALAAKWEAAMADFEARRYEEARKAFAEILSERSEDRVAALYVGQCDSFIAAPPASNWDGVFNLTEK